MEKIPELKDLILEFYKKENFGLVQKKFDVAESIKNFPTEKVKKIHLAEWYADFWKLSSISILTQQISDEEKIFCQKLLEEHTREKNPVRLLYLSLALLIFGNPTKIMGAETLPHIQKFCRKII